MPGVVAPGMGNLKGLFTEAGGQHRIYFAGGLLPHFSCDPAVYIQGESRLMMTQIFLDAFYINTLLALDSQDPYISRGTSIKRLINF